MIYELNQEAFHFIALLSPKPIEPKTTYPATPVDIKGISMIMELNDIEIKSEGLDNPFTGELRAKYYKVGNSMLGLNEKDLQKFRKFLLKVYDFPIISKICKFETLIEIGIEWLIEVHERQLVDLQFIDYILNKIESLTAAYVFYFRMTAIGIEDNFTIGNTEFKYFNNNEIEAHYQAICGESSKLSREDFMLTIGDQYKHINAIVQIKGEIDKATEDAFKEVELSVDVLKCFCFPYMMAKTTRNFDLDYRHPGSSSANYMCMVIGDVTEAKLNITAMRGVRSIEVTKSFLQEAKETGMDIFSSFLQDRKDNVMDIKIVEMIKLFAIASSSHDKHEKVIKCISLFESLAIPEGNPKAKGFTLFKKVTEKLISEHELKAVQDIGLEMYKIRDKLMHNNIRWPFEAFDLLCFMDFMRIFIISAIHFSKKNGTLDDFHAHYGIPAIYKKV